MKPTLTFDEAYARLHKAEGGFSDDPADPGNWTGGRPGAGILKGTKYGIAANTYPDLDIRNLTQQQAKDIYYRDWWLKAGGDHFHAAIVFQLWDFAVNSGMDNAKRKLQRAAGVTDDGIIGDRTIAAVNGMDLNDWLFLFNAEKIEFYTSLSTWPKYGKGWMNRTAQNLRYCASDNIDLPPAIVGIPQSELPQWTSYPSSAAPSASSVPSSPQSLPQSATVPSSASKVPTPQPLPPANAKPLPWWSVLARLLQRNPQP